MRCFPSSEDAEHGNLRDFAEVPHGESLRKSTMLQTTPLSPRGSRLHLRRHSHRARNERAHCTSYGTFLALRNLQRNLSPRTGGGPHRAHLAPAQAHPEPRDPALQGGPPHGILIPIRLQAQPQSLDGNNTRWVSLTAKPIFHLRRFPSRKHRSEIVSFPSAVSSNFRHVGKIVPVTVANHRDIQQKWSIAARSFGLKDWNIRPHC